MDDNKLTVTAGEIEHLTLNGIPAGNKTSIDQFSPLQKLKLYSTIAQGRAEFSIVTTIYIRSKTRGKITGLTLSSINWKFLFMNKNAASGEDENIYPISGTSGTEVNLKINFDAAKLFPGEKTETVINNLLKIFSRQINTGKGLLQFNADLSADGRKSHVAEVITLF